jgi:hypothetical protein
MWEMSVHRKICVLQPACPTEHSADCQEAHRATGGRISVGDQDTAEAFGPVVRSLDRTFHALADLTRRAMLRRLAKGEQSIGELAARFSMSFAAVSKHVKVLERARLLRPRGKLVPMSATMGLRRGYDVRWNSMIQLISHVLPASAE